MKMIGLLDLTKPNKWQSGAARSSRRGLVGSGRGSGLSGLGDIARRRDVLGSEALQPQTA